MTDETKACKKAGTALYKQLEKAGVELTGVGVGVSDDNQLTIEIRLMKDEDLSKVPAVFEGYEVRTIITGVIRAL